MIKKSLKLEGEINTWVELEGNFDKIVNPTRLLREFNYLYKLVERG